MNICFVGHVFHQRTRSSAFFLEQLRTIGIVTEFYRDPDTTPAFDEMVIRQILNTRFDRYVFWQSENIAERLLPLELGPSFIVPMYDAVDTMNEDYWLKFIKHRFISFSRVHHEMLQRIGCTTSYFQYYPDPGEQRERRIDAGALDAFFWERRPASAINRHSVTAHCRALGIGRLHVHAIPDFASDPGVTAPSDEDGIGLSVSGWFDSPADYAAVAGAPLFFFAPRLVEGIGMASLEAMARGQIVVAPDRPTTDEYVAHLATGLIYPVDQTAESSFRPLDGETLAMMSRAARRKIVNGRRDWLRDCERLRSLIVDDGQRWSTSDLSSHFVRQTRRAAYRRLDDAV